MSASEPPEGYGWWAGGVAGGFHPAVRTWFARRFPAGPTAPQDQGSGDIAAGRHTLIAAPTGSGKTLAAFLVCIDRLYRAHDAQAEAAAEQDEAETAAGPQVVYISPLKALAVDIWQNLERPLAEIAETAAELGLTAPQIRIAVRTGDTEAAQRAAMLKRPPDFLITTPESLYLLVTAERSRKMLASVDTVIVDEIHAVAGNKRGSHLALTLERLAHLTGRPLQRIGLSATQKPISDVARLLVGAGPARSNPDGSPDCSIVDTGHRRELDLALELPSEELGAVASGEQMDEIIDLIAGRRRAAPDHAGVRQHQAGGRARRARTGRAPGREAWSRPITAVCPRTGASESRPGCAAATFAPWSRPRRWSSASTSGRSSWSARSAPRAASRRSCSESAGPTTAGTACRAAGCIRAAEMSSSNAPPCCAAPSPAARPAGHS